MEVIYHSRRGVRLEIHFGKPVVAKVRKCRTVVVKKKRTEDKEKK